MFPGGSSSDLNVFNVERNVVFGRSLPGRSMPRERRSRRKSAPAAMMTEPTELVVASKNRNRCCSGWCDSAELSWCDAADLSWWSWSWDTGEKTDMEPVRPPPRKAQSQTAVRTKSDHSDSPGDFIYSAYSPPEEETKEESKSGLFDIGMPMKSKGWPGAKKHKKGLFTGKLRKVRDGVLFTCKME